MAILRTSRSKSLLTFSLIFLIAFGLRWTYLVRKGMLNEAEHIPQEMERVAICWAEQGRLADAFFDGSGDTAYLSPVYSVLLGSIYRVAGSDAYHRSVGRSLLGVFMSSMGIALIPSLAGMLRFNRKVGLVAGILLAVTPVFFWLEVTGDWDQSTNALALIVLLMMFIRLHDCQWSSWRLVAITGALVGLAFLLSPSLAPAFALMILAETFCGTSTLRQMIPKVIFLASLVLLMQVPWSIRNYRALGAVVPTRSNFGMNLWMGNNPASIGRSNMWDTSPRLSWDNPFTSKAELDEILRVGEVEYNRQKGRLAMQWITQNPRQFAALSIKRFLTFWFPPADAWAATTTRPEARSLLLLVTALGAFAGVVWLTLAGSTYRWLVLSALIGPSLIYYFIHVNFRYRYPIWGLSVLLSCYFISALASAMMLQRSKVASMG
jgi:dolichyl-phosphate-mannose-protein mannosyltransferase